MMVFKRNFISSFVLGAIPVVFTLIIISMIWFGLRQTETANRAEGVRLLEETLLRVAIHSYAIEGHFPESLDYIMENYGVYIDHSRFIVHYNVFASNILPDIRVFDLYGDI